MAEYPNLEEWGFRATAVLEQCKQAYERREFSAIQPTVGPAEAQDLLAKLDTLAGRKGRKWKAVAILMVAIAGAGEYQPEYFNPEASEHHFSGEVSRVKDAISKLNKDLEKENAGWVLETISGANRDRKLLPTYRLRKK